MNDEISKEECSLQYTSVSEVAAKCVQLGAGTLIGKDGYSASIPECSGCTRRLTFIRYEMAG